MILGLATTEKFFLLGESCGKWDWEVLKIFWGVGKSRELRVHEGAVEETGEEGWMVSEMLA